MRQIEGLHELRPGGVINEHKVEEDFEIEELIDDEPMWITGRLYLGSIDAARNVTALKRLRIRLALALLGRKEEYAAVWNNSSAGSEEPTKLLIKRTIVEIEDSKDGDLLRRMPEILAELDKLLEEAKLDDANVLVHCIAGRSRSPSVLVAWMLVNAPKELNVQESVDQIRIIRPWIDINDHFMKDLQLFCAVLRSTDVAMLSAENVALLTGRSFPRLNFDASLVDGVLRHTKTITMRLLSDVGYDCNSDLGEIFPYSVVAATSTSSDDSSTISQFAYLRIEQIEAHELSSIDRATLCKTGFESIDEVLAVLKQFYPGVTTTTSLLMIHFHCLSPC